MQPIRHDVKILSSWKEIAAYFGKGVRTVQRWEHELGLPVLRPMKERHGIVLATTDKLDKWLAMRWVEQPMEKTSSRKTRSVNKQGVSGTGST